VTIVINKYQLAQSVMLGAVLLSAMPLAHAEQESEVFGGNISGKLTFASDYVFRGESETMDGDVTVVL
jgi:hypothetical protein